MYKNTTLKNGLRIITHRLPYSPSVTFEILIKAGARNEQKDVSGLAHFIEHTVFKGTKKRPSSIQINEEMDQIGGEYNARTGYEFTGFWAKAAKDRYLVALDILSDVVLNATFPAVEINKEKGVILEEIRGIEDVPAQKVVYDFLQSTWGNHGLGRPIAGTTKSVQNIKSQDVLHFRQKYYSADNMLLTISGNVSHSQMVEEVSSYFKTLKRSTQKRSAPSTPKFPEKPVISLKIKPTEQEHIVIGFEGLSRDHPDFHALGLIDAILGSGMSSRLHRVLREELGIAYYAYSQRQSYADTGILLIGAGVDTGRVNQAVEGIFKILNQIKKQGFKNQELEKAKVYMTGQMLLGLETSDELAEWYGLQALLQDKVYSPAQVVGKINAVSLEKVNQLATQLLSSHYMGINAIGPYNKHKTLQDLAQLIS